VERKLLQIAFGLAGLVLVGFDLAGIFFGANFMDLSGNVVMGHGVPTVGIMISLAGELIAAPLLWLWQQHVARVAQRGALT